MPPIARSPRAPSLPLAALAALATLVTAASVASPARAGAQAPAEATTPVSGYVRTPEGIAVAGAEVILTPRRATPGVTMGRRIVTDDSGKFLIPMIPHGTAAVDVRRIGYRPLSVETVVPATTPLALVLTPSAVQLNRVVVQDRRTRYEGPLAAFHRRRDMGFGRFVTRDEIERRNPIRTTDLLRNMPGVMVGPTQMGTIAVRIRSNNCPPLIWLDGSPALAGYLDIDAFGPNTLAGIEVYSGVATVPVELRGARGEERCGVIALWSRVAEPRPRRSKAKPVTAEQLAALVASATVYTADQVDQPAVPDSTEPLQPYYPDSLKLAKVPGHVLLEFVVDTAGNVETETIGVVLSTHPRFTEAARNAVWRAAFSPAYRQGRPVRQLVQLPVQFEVMGGR